MVDCLPVKVLTDEDSPIFGKNAVCLGKLARSGLTVCHSIAITAPNFKLKTVLEHYDLSSKEVIGQSLTLVKKEISKIPLPEKFEKELGKHKKFLFRRKLFKSKKDLWTVLLHFWVDEIKERIWNRGFYPGVTEELEAQAVCFVDKITGAGEANFDPLQDDVTIRVLAGSIHPADKKKIVDIVNEANKKLFLPYEYEWVVDGGVKIVGLKPYTPNPSLTSSPYVSTYPTPGVGKVEREDKSKSSIKVFYDLSTGLTIEKDVDGIFIASEKIFDLNKPRESFEDLVFRVVESATTFPDSPIFFKLADKSEGMGKVRGALRLIHQKSLFDPIVEAVLFARNKKGLKNIHIVIPFVRSEAEFLQIKRELAVKKLTRKSFLQIWMEVATPENIINLENYLSAGVDGVVLNLDELIAHFNGFDHTQEDLLFYKNEVSGLLKFLEDGLKLLHKAKIPFIAYGSLSMYPQVLEFLVEKGVYGLVIEKYEVHSIHDLLHQTEKRLVLRRS